LFDLERQFAVSRERAGLARRQLAELDGLDRELVNRTDAYREGVVQRLSQEVYETTAERTGCVAEVNQRREVGTRMEQLVMLGLASPIRAAEARASEEAALTRCARAQARLARLQVELEAAKTGVFLRDGANDVPYSQQQRDRLLLRRQEMEAQQSEESSRSSKIATEIEKERERVERLSRFDLFLPGGHVVWAGCGESRLHRDRRANRARSRKLRRTFRGGRASRTRIRTDQGRRYGSHPADRQRRMARGHRATGARVGSPRRSGP